MDSLSKRTPLYHYDVCVSVKYTSPSQRLEGQAQTAIVEDLNRLLDIILRAKNQVLSDEELQKKTSREVVDYMVENPNSFFKRTPIYGNNEAMIRLTPDENRIHAVLAKPFLKDPAMNKWSLARGFIWVIQKAFPQIVDEQLEELRHKQTHQVTRGVGNGMLKNWEGRIQAILKSSFEVETARFLIAKRHKKVESVKLSSPKGNRKEITQNSSEINSSLIPPSSSKRASL